MKEKAVVIEIDERGNSSLDLEGFEGRGCADVADAFRGTDPVKIVRNKRELYLNVPVIKPLQRQA